MIRGILGSALPVLGLGLAVAFMGPDLVTGPRGEPMIVGSGEASLKPASFNGEACASKLLQRDTGVASGMRVVAYALRPDGQDFEVAIRDFPAGSGSGTVVLLFDEAGRLVAISKKPTVIVPTASAHADCLKPRASDQKPV